MLGLTVSTILLLFCALSQLALAQPVVLTKSDCGSPPKQFAKNVERDTKIGGGFSGIFRQGAATGDYERAVKTTSNEVFSNYPSADYADYVTCVLIVMDPDLNLEGKRKAWLAWWKYTHGGEQYAVTTIFPHVAKPGQEVTICGIGLGEPGRVALGSRHADVRDWEDQEIIFNVPNDEPPGVSKIRIEPQQGNTIPGGTVRILSTTSPFTGQLDFRRYCAQCHGMDGTGNGPVAPALRVRPTDLTTLADDRDGIYPAEEVQEVLDGRRRSPAHGTGSPIWASAFGRPGEPDEQKMHLVVEYIESIQLRGTEVCPPSPSSTHK